MSDKPPEIPRTGASSKDSSNKASSSNASSSKGAAQNSAKVTPIRESKGVARETVVRQNNELGPHNRSGQSDQKITEQIRIRAYQLFEERGRHAGFEHEDWIRAEAEIRARFQGGKSA